MRWAAAEMVSGFVKASSHNLKYCGIDALARIVRINAKYAGEHQARPALRLQCRRNSSALAMPDFAMDFLLPMCTCGPC